MIQGASARSLIADPVYARSLLLRRLLAEYDRDPRNASPLRDLIVAAGGEDRPLHVSHLDQLEREASGKRARAAIAEAADRLGLDRLAPLRHIEVPAWRDIRGALPDGPTILVRWLSRPDASADPLPPLTVAVMVPMARMDLTTNIPFTGAWDPEDESPARARVRLKRQFAEALDHALAEASQQAESFGAQPQPSPKEEERDIRWLYWHLRDRQAADELVVRSELRCGTSMAQSRDPEELIHKAIVRVAARVGARTRRLWDTQVR